MKFIPTPLGPFIPTPLRPLPIVNRVNGERLVVLGWGRAILMQVAHPLIAAGIDDHSGFRSSHLAPLRRLRSTVRAMLALTFGTEAEAQQAASRILSVHDRVHGCLRDTVGIHRAGTAYTAHDPQLLLWVHATLLDSSLITYEQLVSPLHPRERDEYVSVASAATSRLGLPTASAPQDYRSLQRLIADTLEGDVLTVSRRARALADALVWSRSAAAMYPLSWAQWSITVGMLPDTIRQKYGYPWTPRDQRRLERLLQTIRAVRASAPDMVARWAVARE